MVILEVISVTAYYVLLIATILVILAAVALLAGSCFTLCFRSRSQRKGKGTEHSLSHLR